MSKYLPRCASPAEQAAQTRAMWSMYQGATLDEVGAKFRLSPSGVSKRLRKAGYTLRPSGRAAITSESVRIVCALYDDEKLSFDEIQAETGMSVSAIRRRLIAGGVLSRRKTDRTCWKCNRTKRQEQFRRMGYRVSRVCRKCEEGERCE